MSAHDRDTWLNDELSKYLSPEIAAAILSDSVVSEPPRPVSVEYFLLQFQTAEQERFKAALAQAVVMLPGEGFVISTLFLGCIAAFRPLSNTSSRPQLDAAAKKIIAALGTSARVIYGTATGFQGNYEIGGRFSFTTLLSNSQEALEALMSSRFGTARHL
ncbi:MAG TPA: hypothetical protein VFE47_21745 [Tepidisphaeraceae bacterium]|jgi:hypothetical protein|nr:hypothetical protein [Tepidisphaeraceae bacterium]